MQTKFQVGDIVRVIEYGRDSGHYLKQGAIVTVIEIEGYSQGDFNINVQGTIDSFVGDEYGWYRNPFGKHCQAVKKDQIELLSSFIPVPKKHIDPQIPIL